MSSHALWRRFSSVIMILGMLLSLPVPTGADSVASNSSAKPVDRANQAAEDISDTPPAASDGFESDPAEGVVSQASHRLIIELQSPPLVTWAATTASAIRRAGGSDLWTPDGRLNVQAEAAQNYIAQLQFEQAAFVSAMQTALPSASVDHFINENGQPEAHNYQIVFNGLTIDAGAADRDTAMRLLSRMPEVKAVYLDYPHATDLYTSTTLINAPAAWNNAAIGGQTNAGAGVKVASMDGGVHKDAPMFSGAGYSYPPGFPTGGLGLTANNNGKIIASRAYFRSWDPPSAGDENPWPGTQGTPHGVHTAGIAAGDIVTATYLGLSFPQMSGVAPKAWVMSYRVFYNSVTDNGSFYNAEGLAALEDIVADGAQVLNNSWGGGPGSTGGLYDPLDQALINTANAGVFVSMSTGNAGPGLGTVDHPSSNYINVAASTTSGTLATGRVSVSAPQPISSTLQNRAFGTGLFGAALTPGSVFTHTFAASAVISPTNVNGCSPWPAGTFTGVAAVIQRGTCEFGLKVLLAEQAGAAFVVIYNSAAGGEGILDMGPGAVGNQVTISAIFVQRSMGLGMVDWYTTSGGASELTVDMTAFQAGSTPDRIISFSSRGPGIGNVLKPDIAAPGVNILSQGFTPNTTGEARHLGYGQVSGTSMSAPHVAGAAALLRQIHPDWSNAYIKSALMSTAKYLDIYNFDETPAQPLDMGAGRLDLSNAADPGILLSPPSLSYGLVPTGTAKSIAVTVTSVAAVTETYSLTTLYTGAGFLVTQTTTLPGFAVAPTAISLAPGASAVFTVTFDSATGQGLGDNQGYILLDGATHDGHMPAWARVTYAAPLADVLIIDNDGSSSLGNSDYLSYYTDALTALGYTYAVYDADANFGTTGTRTTIPDVPTLSAYRAIVYYTGDNFRSTNAFAGFVLPLTTEDMDRLNEYAHNGGTIIAMGQDLSSVLAATTSDDPFFYEFTLGGRWLRDSVSNDAPPPLPVIPASGAPEAVSGVSLDLNAPTTYMSAVSLSGLNEVSPVTTTTTGQGSLAFDVASKRLDYTIVVTSPTPITLTAAHVHSGTVGVNGGVLYTLLNATVTETTAYTITGALLINPADVNRLLNGGTYVNVHTDVNPGGEVRDQILMTPVGDGAGNQAYIDEIGIGPNDAPAPDEPEHPSYTPLLKYSGAGYMEDNIVAMAHHDQPTLERPGVSYNGRSIYTTFGLEGVNNDTGSTTREALLQTLLKWAWDQPSVTISQTTVVTNSSALATFSANYTSTMGATGVSYRWDFGDNTGYVSTGGSRVTSHSYAACGTYTARVEVIDSYGNYAIGSTSVIVDQCLANIPADMPLTARASVPVGSYVAVTATVTDTLGAPWAGQPVFFTSNRYGAALSGLFEAPPVTTTLGTGSLSFVYEPATRLLSYAGQVSGLSSNVTAAHIHTGAIGVPGGVLEPLSFITTTNGATFAGAVTLSEVGEALLYNGGLYANVHTTLNSGGEVRGQILDGTFSALLTGASEVPPVATTGAGAVYFIYDPATGMFHYTGQVSGLTSNVTAAHIHTGTAGTTGGVLIPLSVVTMTNGAVFSGTLTQLQALTLFSAYPGGLYVNVHTTANPDGEVRGQIMVGTWAITDAQGQASTTVTSSTPGPLTVTALADDLRNDVTVTFIPNLYLPLIFR